MDKPDTSSRRRRAWQFSCRNLLTLTSGVSLLLSTVRLLPGIGPLLLLLIGLILLPALLIGGLMLLQWPLMVLADRWSHAYRRRRREERRALAVLRR